MLTNVFALGVEIDIVAVFRGGRVPTVSVIEVKRRPKRKLVEQLRRRAHFADLVYAAVPHRYLGSALRRVPKSFGVIAVSLHGMCIARASSFFGRGRVLLEALGLEGVYEGLRAKAFGGSGYEHVALSGNLE